MLVVAPTLGLTDSLKAVRLGIDTHQERVVYLPLNSPVCLTEGFTSSSRVQISVGELSLIASLSIIDNDKLLKIGEIGLSECAWKKLNPAANSQVKIQHSAPVLSLNHLRHKVYGNRLNLQQTQAIIDDLVAGHYTDLHLASFVTSCAGTSMNLDETIALSTAMLRSGHQLDWGTQRVVDKHCVGGLAGNRTTPIVVALVTACGGIMPKTSSRAITSPAGTADTMATMTQVNLELSLLKKVVKEQGGCLAWGGAIKLSPADHAIIRVERLLGLDSEGLMVASILSKKAAAGSTHVLIDIPIGPTAKVRSVAAADRLSEQLLKTGQALGLNVRILYTDGTQPVGRGIGPALEAQDLLAVLRNQQDAPQDLRARSLTLAAELLEMAKLCELGQGLALATRTLDSGLALKKFMDICKAQGGFKEPSVALYEYKWVSKVAGKVKGINNRLLSKLAKLAGAPEALTAGISLHLKLDEPVAADQLLLTLHAESPGKLEQAVNFLEAQPNIIELG